MENFNVVMSKHGEHGVQALLDNWERKQGIPSLTPIRLEDRWRRFIEATDHLPHPFDA